MPLIETDDYQPILDRLIPPSMEEQEDISFSEKLRAAFATENTIGAAIVKEPNLPSAVKSINTALDNDERSEFNPLDHLSEQELADESFLDEVLYAQNLTELEATRKQVEMERENRAKLTGVEGALLSMAAAVVDPVNLIPFGGAAYKTYRAGGSVLRGGVVTASVAGTSALASESLLHSQQLERTFGESAVNVTAASMLGLALGAASAKLSKTQWQTLVKETDEIMDTGKSFPASPEVSAGARAVWENIKIKGKAARIVAKGLAFDPVTRILTGKSQKAKQVLVELAENPIDVDGFTGQAVESLAKTRKDALLYRGLRTNRDVFKAYKKAGGKLKLRGFNQLVSKEVRNPGTIDDIHVSKAAKAWTKEVYEPTFRAAVEARILPEEINIKTAKQYLNRAWNRNKVAANLPKFLDTVSNWLVRRQSDLNKVDADDIANQIAGRIMSTPDGILPYDYKIGTSKHPINRAKLKSPFKSRVFDIEDELVEDFLENDIEKLAARHLRQTSTDIELVNRFGDPKTSAEDAVDLIQQKKDIQDEFTRLMGRAKTEKQRRLLEKEMDRTLSDIQGILERMRGTFDIPDPNNIWHRIAHAARNLNFLRFMGGVTISSFPDSARVVMAEGFGRSFKTILRPLIAGVKKAKLAGDDVRYWGIGTDSITGGRLEVISDINDYALGGTAFERGLQSMANSFGNINLMNQWTSLMKTTHAVAMQSRVMDDLTKGVFDKRLIRLGISADDANRIMTQVQKHGGKDTGAWIYNAKNWDDQTLAFKWAAALKKESDRVIIVPGQERPLFMSTELGKTVMQFKSFMMAATQRILIAGLQGQDAHLVQGLTAMISLGALTYVIKQVESGRPVSGDPKVWIAEGIDRSGAIGILMEINNTVEKVSSNNIGVRPIFGISEGASRYSTRSAKEALLGPTFGSLLDNTLRSANAVSSEYEWTQTDTSAVRRLLPYQNLFVIRSGLDKIQESISE